MRVPHLIAPLVSSGVPERHVIFDTEARRRAVSGGERQTFALAAAEYLRAPKDQPPEVVRARAYTDAADLWRDVLAFTRSKHRTVVWCHNLAYDLRLARALQVLPELGLQLRGIVLDYTSAWASFSGGGRTVLCCDVTSWLPASLAMLGRDLELAQHPLPLSGASDDDLLRRCARDVEITRHAVTGLLELVRREQLGPWRSTGAGQSHAGWRKRFMTTSPFCHDDVDALEAERRAMWTGRCEAWRWGDLSPGPVVEYDLQLAYPHICASERVPEQLIGRVGGGAIMQLLANRAERALLAEVTVSTDRPLVPASHGRFIHWPVGTFDTVLWDPELQLLLDHGAKVKVRRAWLYRRGAALQPFSRWLLDQVQGMEGEHTALQRRALKHMSRAFVGRFAMRYRSWQPYATMPEHQLRLGELHDLQTGERVETLQVGTSFMTLGEHELAEDAVPQVTGWVMSEARARLWRLTELAGAEHVAYMDTDSLLVDQVGARRLGDAIAAGAAWSLREKASYRKAIIHGPRQLQLGKVRRVAGVPLDAIEVGPGEYEGELFAGLRESLAAGDGLAVTVHRRRFKLEAVDTRREHLPAGATAPHQVG